MDIEELERLIANDENVHLELKKTTGELKDGMHTACAFLNGAGGWLVFGVAPKSLKILGQEVTDNTQREIAQALSGLEPAVSIDIQYIDVPDRLGCQVIAMYFEAFVWGTAPYTYHGSPYYKVESTTKLMPRNMFEERLRANKPNYYAWERQSADEITIDDMDEKLIRGAIRLGVEKNRMPATALTEPLSDVLRKLELMNDGVPNNAAAALFSTKLRGYTQMQLRLALFLKHLNMSGKIVGFRREENMEVPAEALREALTNSLCHRQFEKYNLTPSIAIYDDRIEIENPGVLPPQLNTETIKQSHSSYPYNPIMAEVLYRTTFLESWGSGAFRIMEACKAQNAPEPKWSINGGFICVTFVRPVTDPMKTPVGMQLGLNLNQVRTKYEPSTNQVKDLILAVSEDYLSTGEMMKTCGLKSRLRFRTTYILPALDEGAIERKYPDIPNHPRQQYRLTEQAIDFLALLKKAQSRIVILNAGQ